MITCARAHNIQRLTQTHISVSGRSANTGTTCYSLRLSTDECGVLMQIGIQLHIRLMFGRTHARESLITEPIM